MFQILNNPEATSWAGQGCQSVYCTESPTKAPLLGSREKRAAVGGEEGDTRLKIQTANDLAFPLAHAFECFSHGIPILFWKPHCRITSPRASRSPYGFLLQIGQWRRRLLRLLMLVCWLERELTERRVPREVSVLSVRTSIYTPPRPDRA